MSIGQVPQEWKHASLTPVYKSGSHSSVANYRPISLTCVACKLMENIVVAKVLNYLRKKNVISKQQHGFLYGRSTTSNLLETIHDWTLTINNRKAVGVAYIDFKRAFDSVSHVKLFTKLQSYGISSVLLCWIRNFLHCRTQQTRLGNTPSNITNLISGVVQGSVLGPLLFVIFINDIAQLFTDNTVCLRKNDTDLACYNFHVHQPILIIFGRNVAKKASS